VKLWFLAVIVLAGLLDGQTQFVPAKYVGTDSHDLRVFPKDGRATLINIQFPVWTGKFAGNGRSLYASLPIDQRTKPDQHLVRIDSYPHALHSGHWNTGLRHRDFPVTQDRSKVVS
jgi:hypothetical protein